MSNRMSSLEFQPITASGEVYPGAKLQTFFSGTTTPITTYTDTDLTIPHTNPVIADARGAFPDIFLTPALHRMVLLDQNDVQIQVYDPVSRVDVTTETGGTNVEDQTATAGQTTFSNLANAYELGVGGISVYVNGVFQKTPENYTESSTTSITFTTGLEAGDFVVFVTPRETSETVNVGTTRVSIADDNFVRVTAPKSTGAFKVFVEESSQTWGELYFDVTGTAVGEEFYSGTKTDITTGPLTGTTGVDGNLTVSPNNDGDIYIENRLNQTVAVVYGFFVAP